MHEENADLQKKENLRLVEELSRVKALYATRPLLELGLTRYAEKNANLHGGTWTSLSQSFLKEHVFMPNSDDLQQWATDKIARMNKIFQWHISVEDEFFIDFLWNVYSKFSEKYHGLTASGSGFVIIGDSPMTTASAILLVSALRGQRCLKEMTMVTASDDGRRLWIDPDGKLLK